MSFWAEMNAWSAAIRSCASQAKVLTKTAGGLKNKLGRPDLMIFFTNTMSHKLVQGALSEIKGSNTIIERCHTSSLSALRGILEKHMPKNC